MPPVSEKVTEEPESSTDTHVAIQTFEDEDLSSVVAIASACFRRLSNYSAGFLEIAALFAFNLSSSIVSSRAGVP